ncbi:unnamed protein product [Blepharisma stoltei]|uniref:Uncharacterized protein n=1 Tax=Blepharisma stoltei TaxID=1481888 RepID=A0AAU9K3U1_9CILI|nr:unnamed protein product [Blepharisma stoltei]
MDLYQKIDQKTQEIEEKKKLVRNLERATARLQDEIMMLNEKIEQTEDRLEHHGHELVYRRQRLKELSEVSNPQDEEQAVQKQVSAEEAQSFLRNIEKDIKQKILNLISRREILDNDPQELFFFEGQKFEIKPNTIIHTVKVKYISLLLPQEEDRGMKTVPKEATFRITRFTTLKDLRATACEYWNLAPDNCSLRLQNFTTVEKILDQPIDSYFMKNTVFPELWLTENDPRISKYTNKPEQYIDDPTVAIKEDNKSAEVSQIQKAKQEKEKALNILDNYRGLKYYLPPRIEGIEEVEEKRLHGRDTSCCTALFLVLLLALTIYIIGQRRDVTKEYWLQSGISRFAMQEDSNGQTFYDVSSKPEMTTWIVEIVGGTLFSSSTADQNYQKLMHRMQLVGQLAIRQVRTREMSCPRSDLDTRNYTCYHRTYSSSTRQEDTIAGGSETWRTFETASTNGIDSTWTGYLSSYDGSGYVQYYDQSEYTYEKFSEDYNYGVSTGWLSKSTRAIFISGNIYHPSSNYWIYFNAIYECSVDGLVYPSIIETVAFTPNIFTRSKGATTADIFRIIFSLYILYVYVMTILEIKDGKKNIQHALSFQGILDLLLIIFIIVTVGLTAKVDEDEKKIYQDTKYTDLRSTAEWYRFYHNLNACTLTLVLIRIIVFLQVNKRIFILMSTIKNASQNQIAFMVILISVLSSLAIIAQSIWGQNLFMFRSFPYSFLMILLLNVGHGDYKTMFDLDLAWSVIFFLVYFFGIVYFLFAAFMGIYTDSYKMVRLLEGYDDDQNTWKKKDLMLWFIDWIPSFAKRLIVELIFKESKKKVKEEEEEDDDEEID